jgi:hypothetical protein
MPPRPILPLISQRLDLLLFLLKQDMHLSAYLPISLRHHDRRALTNSARACSSSA